MQKYDPSRQIKNIVDRGLSYPAEYVIRIFKGSFPNLSMKKPRPQDKILDVGCGDARHLPFFKSLGMEPYGVEIDAESVVALNQQLTKIGLNNDLVKLGWCSNLPFLDASFDYIISWNSSYYMSHDGSTFESNIEEMTRVLKPGGWFILSVPKNTAFIFDQSSESDIEYCRLINKDPWNERVGEIMRCFSGAEELKGILENVYHNFCYCDINDDCFGLAYHWHVIVAQKKL
jgi:SAM-dependent methyltransferase